MRPVLIAGAALIAVGLVALWLTGADRVVMQWALEGQQDAQNALARPLRALRAGQPGATGAFLAACFVYGFFHAAGPGHGKLLIGGYGAARRVGVLRLSGVAIASSFAQALTAVALVGAGLWLLGWGRERMTGLAEEVFAPLSFAAIALVGLWLAFRGARALWRSVPEPALARAAQGHHAHAHDHHHDAHCASCGHAHAPDAHAIEGAAGWRDIAVLIGAVAIRPCTGALFVLILTAQMGIFGLGVLGAFAMGLGTASVTVAVAIAAVTLREGTFATLSGPSALARAQPVAELGVGLIVALIAGSLTLAAL